MQKYIRSFTLLSAYLLLIACASQAHNGVTPATLSPQSLKRLGEFHWEQRHKIKRAKKALEYFETANKYYPDDSELAALYSRACYFNGNYIETDPILKDSLFIKGAVAAQSIILQHSTSAIAPEIIENSGSPWLVNVENISEELVPIYYWWAANAGRYLIDKPIKERLRYRDLLESVFHQLLTLNPNFFYGGPYRLMAVFYVRIPGIELIHSESYFSLAINSFPNYFATAVLKAQFYCTKSGQRAEFHKLLMEIMEADPSAIPDAYAENLFEQKMAEMLLDQESLLFK